MTVPAGEAMAVARPRRFRTLGLLAVVAFLATLDRQAFVVLLVPIQQELQASDTAMGFLMGSVFALAQAIFSLPMGTWVDRMNRRNLLAIALAIWSVATVLCGLAGSFTALVAARLVVGAAEAAQTPATASLVGDLFGRNQRGSAFMLCSVGMASGVAFGSYAGGRLSDQYGWHVALFIVGAPGLLVALLMYMTVREPARGLPRASTPEAVPATRFWTQIRRILAVRSLPPFMAGFALLQASVMGWFVWFPVLLMRVHGLSATEMGTVFGTIVLCGVLSAIWSGPISDLLARWGPRWRIYFLVAITVLSIPLIFASSLLHSVAAAQVCAMGFTLVAGGHHPVAMATYTSLAPPAMRGSVAALVYLAVLVGAALAPLVFGALNDALSARYGDQSVRYTLTLAPVMLAASSAFFWLARRTVEQDMARAG